MNPIAGSIYGDNDLVFAHNGPESLTEVAQHIGAHIYIANVGGPEVLIPGGSAAQSHPAQVNGAGSTPTMGSNPSFNMQVDPRQTAALNYFAYRTSTMMRTAADTLGGFSNSLKDLAGQIHQDLDENYSLDFNLTAADRDKGIPSVEIRLANHDLRLAILDIVPIGSARELDRETVSKELVEKIKQATRKPVTSTDFAIHHHIDYFPLGAGLTPVLPMSGLIEWTGQGKAPGHLSVAESVEDLGLSTTLLEHDLHVNWNGHSMTWERDGYLLPGHYVWRIAIHDAQGNVFASAEEKLTVEFPRQVSIATSSLIVGKACREAVESVSGMRRRSPGTANDETETRFQIDPMHAADCRLKAESLSNFAPTDTLHAFVRIYPSEKLEKNKPESWTAKFVLRSQAGSIETEQEMPFTVDSGSGYLAYVEIPLNRSPINPGLYTLNVQMRGPGIRHDLHESRTISISGSDP